MKIQKNLKYLLITIAVLSISVFSCLLIKKSFNEVTLIPVILLLGTFLICALTEGYIYGIVASVSSVLIMNFAFTFPFFKIDFAVKENFLSAVILMAVTLITCTMTEEIRRHEILRLESEKEKMRANLLRAISHDLRTPLTTIYGTSCALLENNNEFTPELKEQLLKGIKEDSLWLCTMVENLLSVTRLDGNVNIKKVDTVLDELLDAVIVKFKKRYENQAVEVEMPEELLIVPMDAILIKQVIINLLENAVQHATGMDKLKIRIIHNMDKVVFEIEDNGCGIAKNKMNSLFVGCYSDDKIPADGQKRNAGIGLSVCATIIKAHGGEIGAQNLKSGGALFRFTLKMEADSNE